MAREVAALERSRLRADRRCRRSANGEPRRAKRAFATRVEIECPELCGRYTARVLRGVKVQPSPDWLRRRLEALGQASINNVVDATNYVMLELGQPMHAFDLDRLAERRIVVRRARAGEKMRTLDGVERALSPEMCVIADAARAVAIGGVMGGAESEIHSAHAQCSARIGVVRSHFHSPHFESAGLAHGSFAAIRARRRSGNGRAGFAALRGAHPRDSPAAKFWQAWWTSIPGAASRCAFAAFAQGASARDGRATCPTAKSKRSSARSGFAAPRRTNADRRRAATHGARRSRAVGNARSRPGGRT